MNVREDLKSFAPSCPIINSTPQNLKENLRLLIEDETLRRKLGEKGRKYVENTHDPIKIGKKVIEYYREIL